MKCEAMYETSNEYGISEMCRALGIYRSTYYYWEKRKEGIEEQQEKKQEMISKIKDIFDDNNQTYGYRRMQLALLEGKIELSTYKIRKMMREIGLYPVIAKKFNPYPNKKSDGRYSDNVLQQKFDVEEPNKVWAGDITYIKTGIGWAYLSIVMDLFNREIIGYSLSKSVDTDLVMRALGNAIHNKEDDKELMFHSDRGCQYSSKSFGNMLNKNGIIGSMSRAGCPYDNSCVEGFFSVLKRECIYRRKYSTMDEVEQDLFEYIELFYNRKRMHSTLGYKSPVKYRMQYNERKVA